MAVVVATDTSECRPHVAAWRELARHASEPNVFYEEWMLLPALEFLDSRNVEIVFVYDGSVGTPDRLLGVFPLRRRQRSSRFPVEHHSLWRHIHCFLCTPLVRASRESRCFQLFFAWFGQERRKSAFLELPLARRDGPFISSLQEYLSGSDRLWRTVAQRERALLHSPLSASEYGQRHLSKRVRKDTGRRRRRLEDQGHLELQILAERNDLHRWTTRFVELEASGWKGQKHTALRSSESGQRYFQAIASAAFDANQLMMLALVLDDRPIAMQCNFGAADARGSFSFKMAFDEAYGKYSPGQLLELLHLDYFLDDSHLEWMDSCAAPDHAINRLWNARRGLSHLIVESGHAQSRYLVRLLGHAAGAARQTRRLVRRLRSTSAVGVEPGIGS